ncbi:LacI family DNA-binding transcriptional regulator [Rhizobium sp. RCAM05973]|uniref:LacI family DNA-binding transcriptional regulator n=1 Tax=Rhizobium sp. RCAM05973 TaxID=2994066 RepID=UPI0022EBB7EB|nr:LacI family DNA-binding transcriptional regulator [Rhizobium sp. RCAM05973]
MASKRLTTRITLTDVAKRAGVGTASVDRVINDRGNVSEEVSKRVLQAAKELGLRRMLPQSHRRLIRIDVILARPELPLIARMGFEFRRLSTSLDRSIIIHRTVLEDERAETLAKALTKTSCDAVVSYMQDHPIVHAAVEELSAKGIPVVTVISDVPGSARIGYAGTESL